MHTETTNPKQSPIKRGNCFALFDFAEERSAQLARNPGEISWGNKCQQQKD